jgi:hypothetical protein
VAGGAWLAGRVAGRGWRGGGVVCTGLNNKHKSHELSACWCEVFKFWFSFTYTHPSNSDGGGSACHSCQDCKRRFRCCDCLEEAFHVCAPLAHEGLGRLSQLRALPEPTRVLALLGVAHPAEWIVGVGEKRAAQNGIFWTPFFSILGENRVGKKKSVNSDRPVDLVNIISPKIDEPKIALFAQKGETEPISCHGHSSHPSVFASRDGRVGVGPR